MPEIDISAGDTVELVTGSRGDAYTINTTGEIRIHSVRSFARQGRTLVEDDRAEVELNEDGEGIYAHAVEDATVEYAKQGFSLSLFGREIIRVENSPNQSNLNSSIQTNASETVEEKEITQTENVAGTESEFTTVTAPAGELWELRHMYLQSPDIDNTGSGSEHGFAVRSGESGIMIADGQSSIDNDVEFSSGQWITATNYGRSNFKDLRVTENLAVEIEYYNGTGVTQTNDRTIRLHFRRIL